MQFGPDQPHAGAANLLDQCRLPSRAGRAGLGEPALMTTSALDALR